MRKKYILFSFLVLITVSFVLFNKAEVRADQNTDVVTVKYYLDDVSGTYIGESKVNYTGLSAIKDVGQLNLSYETIQKFHQKGYAAELYCAGKVVSYDTEKRIAYVVYERIPYTIIFHEDSVDGIELGRITERGLAGDVITDRYLGKSKRNTYKPQSGYLSGQVYKQIRLSDTTNIIVDVVYYPIVMQSKIFFYNVAGTSDYGSDAILIESNGHFGLVDCGEDRDYPSGSDLKYPLRMGIATRQYVNEQDLINFLHAKGITELDFIILTHAHSDHMGAADEIMEAFDVDKVYAREYSDSYITDETRLWDNQYVYDNMTSAVKKYGVTLIQDFTADNTAFQFEDLYIQIKNYETDYIKGTTIREPKWDDNENSLGVLVTDSYNHRIFLAGDIDNVDGDENKLAQDTDLQNLTVLKLAHHGLSGSNTTDYLNAVCPVYAVITGSQAMMDQDVYNQLESMGTKMYFVHSCQEGITLEIPSVKFIKEKEYGGWFYDAALKETYYYNMGEKARNCELVLDGKNYRFDATGRMYCEQWYEDESTGNWYFYGSDGAMKSNGWLWNNGKWYYLQNDGRMLTSGWLLDGGTWYYLSEDGTMVSSDWGMINGKWYYFQNDGAMVSSGWRLINNKWYYFAGSGAMYESQWLLDRGIWYYLDESGAMISSDWGWIHGKWYYFQSDGAMVSSGWSLINNKWYYFSESGVMYENQWLKYKGSWYYMGSSGAMVTSEWILYNGKWYYMKTDGIMAENTYIGNYYVNRNGVWTITK